MQIAVLGSTGKTGQEIVRQALAAGHRVVALARWPLSITHENLRVVLGDARDPEAVAQILDGTDGVISSLGRPAQANTDIDDSQDVDVCLVSTQHLFAQGARRVVLMSTHGAGGSNDGSPYVVQLRELVGRRVADKDDMEAFIASSDAAVDWTVLRNPLIYDGEIGREYTAYEQVELDDTSRITYADLSAFALAEITEPRHVGKFLTLTEPLTGPAAGKPARVAG